MEIAVVILIFVGVYFYKNIKARKTERSRFLLQAKNDDVSSSITEVDFEKMTLEFESHVQDYPAIDHKMSAELKRDENSNWFYKEKSFSYSDENINVQNIDPKSYFVLMIAHEKKKDLSNLGKHKIEEYEERLSNIDEWKPFLNQEQTILEEKWNELLNLNA